jgi:hypothetical protein
VNDDYQLERGAVVRARSIPEINIRLQFRAEQVRLERTGVHAKLNILANGAVLAWSNFNVERDEDRVRLANSAYKHLESAKNVYPPTYLKADLDNFCLGLWDVHLGQLMPQLVGGSAERTAPSFALKPYIIDGGGTIAFAPPGRGKSYVMYTMAVCIDAGLSDLWPVRNQRVLLINLERSAKSVSERLGNINEVLGLDRQRRIRIQNARGKSLSDVITAAERYIETEGVTCIFLDSISRAGMGDLNDNQAVNRIVDQLNGLCPSWFALAHTPRSDESHVFGGVHFDAGADVVVQLLSEQEDGGPLGIGLQITKNNDVGPQPLWIHALEFDDEGLTGIRRARAGEFPGITAGRKMSMRETVRQHLLDVGAQNVYEICEATGFNRSKVATLLANDSAFVKAGTLGRKQLYAVRA